MPDYKIFLKVVFVNCNFFYRFKNLVDYFKKHYDGLEVDVQKELNVYKVSITGK